jgi:hypothetical protein
MNSIYVEEKLRHIDSLFGYFDALNLDEELKSHIAKYLTVLISGIYEDSIETILKESIFRNGTISPEIANFISAQIGIIFRNPSRENIIKLLNQFSENWSAELKEKIEVKDWDCLNSICNNKNQIAHGNSCEITFADIKQFFISSQIILTELDALIFKKKKG